MLEAIILVIMIKNNDNLFYSWIRPVKEVSNPEVVAIRYIYGRLVIYPVYLRQVSYISGIFSICGKLVIYPVYLVFTVR